MPLVIELRNLGHDVLTSLDAGNANTRVPDETVLEFAVANKRILLSHNRKHFFRLHKNRVEGHSGMVLCTCDRDFQRQALRIDSAVAMNPDMENRVIRVNRASVDPAHIDSSPNGI